MTLGGCDLRYVLEEVVVRKMNWLCVFLVLGGALAVASAGERSGPSYDPPVKPASDAAAAQIEQFKHGDQLDVSLFAAEPDTANIVAFDVDDRGRVYVAESYRANDKGALDTRKHPSWRPFETHWQSVQDRVTFVRRRAPKLFENLTKHHDLVRLLRDTDDDGRVDASHIFADGFNAPAAGAGAGVLARDGRVWYTCIPNFWQLRDTNGDHWRDVKKSLSYGYGINYGVRGHDMHGPVFGPDGKIYYSIGDRGYNVTTPDGDRLKSTRAGAVFRCNPDGSELERYATGLRNPQQLAFDRYGRLFTGDNNSDAGDASRWVYVQRGSDAGWRFPYQTLSDRGPWGRGKLWQERFDGQRAYILPPVATIPVAGPAGLAHNPGRVALGEQYDGAFFLADFRGAPARSGIWALHNATDGAGFKLAKQEKFFNRVLVTDVEFAPDGGLYISDWVQGWNGIGRGRLYRVANPKIAGRSSVQSVERLLGEGMSDRPRKRLLTLLGHADQRVRQRAQFELARRGAAVIEPVTRIAQNTDRNQMARIHAIWTLWQLAGDGHPAALDSLSALLGDDDPHVRAQAARVLGDTGATQATDALIKRLKDRNARVQAYAAQALGQLEAGSAIEPLLALLRRNDDADANLRHAAVMGLTGIGDVEAMLAYADDASRPARLGILLALRRLEHPALAQFLDDPNAFLVTEAAWAIHDRGIERAMPALAGLIDRKGLKKPSLLRRVINANFRLGGRVQARAVARFAARAEAPTAMRLAAIDALRQWPDPPKQDRVTNYYRPLPDRPRHWAAAAARPILGPMLAGDTPAPVRRAAVGLAGHYDMTRFAGRLVALVGNADAAQKTRAAALDALANMPAPDQLQKALQNALKSNVQALRQTAYQYVSRFGDERAVALLNAVLKDGDASIDVRQTAIKTLAGVDHPRAERIMLDWLERLDQGRVPAALQFDLLEAARGMDAQKIQQQVQAYEKAREDKGFADRHRPLLAGGDAQAGKDVFFNHAAASCVRCHQMNGRGSSEVGPDLTGVGARREPAYLLNSLINPSDDITDGYGVTVLTLKDGSTVSGTVQKQTDQTVTLENADGKTQTVKQSRIEARTTAASAMPPMDKLLKDKQLRDLIAYLKAQKSAAEDK
jgi:quinoprotein glucose dehydrogenase